MRSLLLTLILYFTLVGCSKESSQTPAVNTAPFELTYSAVCGWGFRNDSLFIRSDSVVLDQEIRPINGPGLVYRDSSFVTPQVWLNLIDQRLDWVAFQSINQQNGGLPYDDCDLGLSIKKDGQQHQITFEKLDSIPSLKPFMALLDSLWQEAGGLYPPTSP